MRRPKDISPRAVQKVMFQYRIEARRPTLDALRAIFAPGQKAPVQFERLANLAGVKPSRIMNMRNGACHLEDEAIEKIRQEVEKVREKAEKRSDPIMLGLLEGVDLDTLKKPSREEHDRMHEAAIRAAQGKVLPEELSSGLAELPVEDVSEPESGDTLPEGGPVAAVLYFSGELCLVPMPVGSAGEVRYRHGVPFRVEIRDSGQP